MELLDDVENDLSAFHRINDFETLDAPRFYRLAERLPLFDGAVRFSLLKAKTEHEEEVARLLEEGQPKVNGAAALAAQSDVGAARFPGFEYKS